MFNVFFINPLPDNKGNKTQLPLVGTKNAKHQQHFPCRRIPSNTHSMLINTYKTPKSPLGLPPLWPIILLTLRTGKAKLWAKTAVRNINDTLRGYLRMSFE